MDVTRIDGRDPDTAYRFWQVGRDAEAAYRVHDFWTPWESAKVTLRDGRPGMEMTLLGAVDDGVLVGAAGLWLPLWDNRHLAFLSLHVHPEHQRRGAGTLLAVAAEDAARSAGRRTVVGEAVGPVDAPSAGQLFAETLGYTVAIEDGMKVVDLVETEPTWDVLEKVATERSAGYHLVAWYDVVPEELVEGYCRLGEAFNDEAPTGELDLEAEVWDRERIRQRAEENAARGKHDLGVAALTPDGTMVGLTEIVVSEHAPGWGFQSGTLVLPEHRGHGLGVAMKVANQRAVRRAFPACRLLVTGNAGVNAAMNAVNDQLGYRLVERSVEMQKQL